MELVYQCCAGIDVHKRILAVCVSRWEQGRSHLEKWTTGATTGELRDLGQRLLEMGVEKVAMESTGVYWMPVWNVLESAGLDLVLVNPEHCKSLRGKKTDLKDGERICELMQHGLLEGSFVPREQIRALRELTRYRTRLAQRQATISNRIQKVLEEGNIKLASVISDVLGVSGRAMLRGLLAGDRSPAELAKLARGRVRASEEQLAAALEGHLLEHHRFLLERMLEDLEHTEQSKRTVERELEKLAGPFEDALRRLDGIPGVNRTAAWSILAELGDDMSQFPTVKHAVSWAGICPGNHETGGKRLKGTTRKGNRWLRRTLCEVAWAAKNKHDSYPRAQYQRLSARRGHKRAILAVANSLLTIAYHLLRTQTEYRELGADYFDQRQKASLLKRSIQRLERLGYKVTLSPAA
jgi:transposase